MPRLVRRRGDLPDGRPRVHAALRDLSALPVERRLRHRSLRSGLHAERRVRSRVQRRPIVPGLAPALRSPDRPLRPLPERERLPCRRRLPRVLALLRVPRARPTRPLNRADEGGSESSRRNDGRSTFGSGRSRRAARARRARCTSRRRGSSRWISLVAMAWMLMPSFGEDAEHLRGDARVRAHPEARRSTP